MIVPPSPGLHPCRLARLMRAAIQRCALNLGGSVVLTEAATGAYAVTPVLAALAGADHVCAMTRPTRYGTLADVTRQTLTLADVVGVSNRIRIVTEKRPEIVAAADIVTNSGHLRPIDATMIGWMKSSAVIPLMYEAWEFRSSDVDLTACRQRGAAVAGTNERHPAVDVFSYLGMMALKLLTDAGVAVPFSHVLVLCDNAFGPYIAKGLGQAGAAVDLADSLSGAATGPYDAILVALQPGPEPVLAADAAQTITTRWPGAVVAQFWGDLDRSALAAHDVPVWPLEPPGSGHMGILPSDIGPEPVVRLQAGGLKVGQILLEHRSNPSTPLSDLVQPLCFRGQP